MVNVDFEWFNFDPEIDFHGVKSLLKQLFDVDAPLLDVSALTDLVLSQHTIGSTVKVDSKANDAYAFLTALNLAEHHEKKSVADLIKYIVDKASTNQSLGAVVPRLIGEGKQVGLVLAERLINMPPEISPPMYSMLIDEIEAAVEDKEPYEFSHYLIVSKTYHEVQSILDNENRQKRKKQKEDAPMFHFHPEDEVLQKHALAYGSYPYTNEETVADSKRAFQEMGVKTQGFMMLIEAGKFQGAAKAIGEYLSPSA